MTHRFTGTQVGASIKPEVGSQGTLLRMGSDQMADNHWSRGYGPERLHMIADSMFPSSTPSHSGTNSIYTRSFEEPLPDSHRPLEPNIRDREPTRKMIDTVARSTVPKADIDKTAGDRLEFFSYPGAAGENAGTFTGGRGRSRNLIAVNPPYTGGKTVIHEIGHSVSATRGTSHSTYLTQEQKGQEEAFADDYAAEHFRDRKGRPTIVAQYGGGRFTGHIKRSEDFWDSYQQHRQTPSYAPQGHDPWWPKEQVPGQMPMLAKDLDFDHPDGYRDGDGYRHTVRAVEFGDEAEVEDRNLH